MQTPKILVRKIKNTPVSLKIIKISIKKLLVIIITIFLVFLAIPFSLNNILANVYQSEIYRIENKIPETRVAIVFGAALQNAATEASPVLEDRVMTAVALYKKGIVKKIIMSGDNRFADYNEPQVMIDLAKKNGVSEFDLQADFAGRRTYDTCLRAKEIFGVNSAILVTQSFHLPRALYICNSLGINAIGVSADQHVLDNLSILELREFWATVLSFWDVNIQAPADVVLGEKISF